MKTQRGGMVFREICSAYFPKPTYRRFFRSLGVSQMESAAKRSKAWLWHGGKEKEDEDDGRKRMKGEDLID